MNRLITAFFALALSGMVAQTTATSGQPKAASRPAPKTAPVKRHPDGRPLGIPFTATKIDEGAWRAIEDGKPVIYRSTAFGFSKVTEEENGKIQRMLNGKPDEPTDVSPGVSVVEKDGKLHFSRITPFGNYNWVKEKNELNPAEKAVWANTQAAASQGASKK